MFSSYYNWVNKLTSDKGNLSAFFIKLFVNIITIPIFILNLAFSMVYVLFFSWWPESMRFNFYPVETIKLGLCAIFKESEKCKEKRVKDGVTDDQSGKQRGSLP